MTLIVIAVFVSRQGDTTIPPDETVRRLNQLPLGADDMSIGLSPHSLHVVLGDHPISDDDFSRVISVLRRGLPAFESLDLVVLSPHASRRQLGALTPFEHLRGVVLSGPGVDDTWIEILAKHGPRVQSLKVIDTKVTSPGLLPPVSLKDLRFLLVGGSKLDVEVRNALRTSNSSLEIVTRP